jgi:DNA-binding SARP family transcriptional activator
MMIEGPSHYPLALPTASSFPHGRKGTIPMAHFSIHLLGRFRADLDGQPVTGLDGVRVQELLCYLLLNRDRVLPRETLAGTLWGDGSTAKSRKQLRQAIWQLHTALNAQIPETGRELLDVDNDWIRLNVRDRLWLDVEIVETAYLNSTKTRGQVLCDAGETQLRSAVALYDGDLLEGWYQDWCLFGRERFQTMYLGLLDRLMVACEANRDYQSGIAYGARALAVDRAREYTHRRLMRLAYLDGDRTGALRQFERCQTSLQEELGVEPAAATIALYEMIRSDRLDDGSRPRPEPLPEPPTDIPSQLQHLRAMLEDLHRHVQRDIQIVDLALDQA